MTIELKGKTTLITGAASGIGAACAKALAEAGSNLVLTDINDLNDTQRCLDRFDIHVRTQLLDIADEASVKNLFSDIDSLDIVINSAGILIEKSLLDMTLDEFDRVIDVNLRGTFLIGKYGLPRLAKRKSSRFIAITSELAYVGRTNFSAYVASKAGVTGLVKSWAREFAPNVLVNALAPGPTETPMLETENMTAEAIAEDANNPLGRIAQPEEIAAAARFLAGPGASFMTGQTVSPNGGAVMI